MENASKALIIAGAILLSILIIALGIYVFNMAKGATNTNQLDELEVSQFNQVFTNYRGRVMGSGVIDLLDKVIAGATTNKGAADRLPDVLFYASNATSPTNNVKSTANNSNIAGISAVRSQIVERHYYYVDFVNDDDTGLIKAIVIVYDEARLNAAKTAAAGVNAKI